MFLLTLIVSITAVSAASDSNVTKAVTNTVKAESNTNNQVSNADVGKVVTSTNNVVSSTKNSTKSLETSTSDVKTSEVKSTNNDKISNESGSKALTSNSNTNITNTQTNSQATNKTQVTSNSTKSLKTSTSNVKANVVLKTNSITTTPCSNITINATAYTSNNEPINGVDTVFKINGVTIGKAKTVNGVASLNYTVPKWSAKDYTLLVKIGETKTTLSQTTTSILKLVKNNVTIKMASYSTSPKSNIVLKANVTYANNVAVDNVPFVFKVNGVTVGKTTVKNGVASLNYVTPSSSKTYVIEGKIGETSYSNLNSAKSNLVLTSTSNIVISKNFVVAKKAVVTLVAKVTDVNGNLASNGKVAFKINGKTISTVSLVKGSATVKYNTSALSKVTNTITVVYSGNTYLKSSTINSTLKVYSSTFSYKDVLKKAYDTKVFIEKYKYIPNYVTFGNTKVLPTDYLYMISKVFASNNTFYAVDYKLSTTSSTTSKTNVNIYKSDYVALAKDIVNNFDTYGYSPLTYKASGYTMNYDDAFYMLTRAVAYMYTTGSTPIYSVLLDVDKISGSSSGSGSGTNSSTSSNTVPAGYSQYLVSSSNCQVNNSAIKTAVAKATAGISGTYNQAVAIFNYVNKLISYSGYSNTRYGAVGTLTRGYGNCVDTSHLIIAMMRTANIPARYCHSRTCYFRSGLVVGHVWAEVYVGGKWYKCDGTSRSNTFGNIVNGYSCTSIARYISLPF